MASYEKRDSGLWSVRFRMSHDDGSFSNKRLSGYKTKKEAQYAYEDYLKDEHLRKEKEKQLSANKNLHITFELMFEKYLEFKKTRIKDSSYYDLRKKLSARLLPFFSEYEMKDITPSMVLEYQKTLSDYSYRYQKAMYGHLSGLYRFAERYYDIPNIMNKVDRPRNLEGKKEMLIYTPEEFYKMLDHVSRHEYAVYFKFLYIAGCRRGEALALRWDDIDFNTGNVKINKSITHRGNKPGETYHETTTKNMGSNRQISLPNFFLNELLEYKKWQKENFVDIKYVFCGKDPLPPTSIERHLTTAAKKAGVKRIRVHDLRHSAASFLIHKGISIVAVSRRLGHTSTEQTLNTYSHLLPDDQKMILGVLDVLG